MWYRLKRVRAPTLGGLGLLVSLVLALAAGVLLMAPSPAASATNPPGEGSSPPGTGGEDNVKLLINDTDFYEDDFVPIQKTGTTMQVTPYNTPAGRTDNGVPMKVTYIAPEDWPSVTLKLNVTATSGGLEIRLTDGTTPYPLGGTPFTPNQSKEVLLYCTAGCTNIDDITIKATVRAGDVRGSRKATGISVKEHLFRGSDCTGQKFHGEYPSNQYPINMKCGVYIYPGEEDHIFAQCEDEFTVLPDVKISTVQWSVPRWRTDTWWGPGVDPREQKFDKEAGGTQWYFDGAGTPYSTIDPQITNTHIMRIDGPGVMFLTMMANHLDTRKGKSLERLEVKIGEKWYIISEPVTWHNIDHIAYNVDNDNHWGYVPGSVNRVLEGDGGLAGFAAGDPNANPPVPPWPEN